MKRLMEYRIISGRTVETRRCWLPSASAPKKPRGTRRAGSSSAKKIAANERSCVLSLARTVNCNFGPGDWFVALKYDEEHYPAAEGKEDEYQACKKIFTKKFLPELRRRYEKETGKTLRAVYVTANWSAKRKHLCRVHHHAVLPADALPIAEKVWKKLGGESGTLQAETLNSEGDYSRLAAYMIDNVQARPANENRWSATRGLAKPVVTEPVEVADVEGIEPMPGAVVKDVSRCKDEDGRVISAYMRQTLPEAPRVRGGQIVWTWKRKRGGRKTT